MSGCVFALFALLPSFLWYSAAIQKYFTGGNSACLDLCAYCGCGGYEYENNQDDCFPASAQIEFENGTFAAMSDVQVCPCTCVQNLPPANIERLVCLFALERGITTGGCIMFSMAKECRAMSDASQLHAGNSLLSTLNLFNHHRALPHTTIQ